MAKTTSRNSFFSKKLLIGTANILLIIGLAAFGGYFYNKYNDLKNANPEELQKTQVQQTIDKVGKLYSLPANEEPDVATVKDKEQLKKEYPFFDQAENDDVVLIYKEAKIAILYRPSTNQLVKVGPVNIEEGVSIRVVGADADRSAVEKTLTDQNITFTKASAKGTLSGITVVDVGGKNTEQAKTLAGLVKGKVGTLPAGEEKPNDVDLIVFVGPTATTE